MESNLTNTKIVVIIPRTMVHYFTDDEKEYEVTRDGEEIFPDVDETEGNQELRIQKLKAELKECQKERKDYLDGWQRAKADYLNSKKRYDEERKLLLARGEDALIEKLLPLADSFDMALAHEKEGSAWGAGFTQIHSQLRSLLQSFGVVEVEALGKPFNPNLHEALSTKEVEEGEHEQVVEVLQKGYMRGDTLLRPAKVVIGVLKS